MQEAQRAAKSQGATEKPSKPAEQAPTTAKQAAATAPSHHPVAKKADRENKQEQSPHLHGNCFYLLLLLLLSFFAAIAYTGLPFQDFTVCLVVMVS